MITIAERLYCSLFLDKRSFVIGYLLLWLQMAANGCKLVFRLVWIEPQIFKVSCFVDERDAFSFVK